MIVGNVNDALTGVADPALLRALDYFRRHDMAHMEKGSYPIDGQELFVNVVGYETKPLTDTIWEAHRHYLDVHVLISGEERIDLNRISRLRAAPFCEEKDYLPLTGEANCTVVLQPGDFLICYPEDGHRTAIAADEPCAIKKAIFKVRVRP